MNWAISCSARCAHWSHVTMSLLRQFMIESSKHKLSPVFISPQTSKSFVDWHWPMDHILSNVVVDVFQILYHPLPPVSQDSSIWYIRRIWLYPGDALGSCPPSLSVILPIDEQAGFAFSLELGPLKCDWSDLLACRTGPHYCCHSPEHFPQCVSTIADGLLPRS